MPLGGHVVSANGLTRLAADQLQANGYLVELEARTPLGNTGRDIRADIIARSGNEQGDLAVDVVVEVKDKLDANLEGALVQISRIASILGAPRAYLFS